MFDQRQCRECRTTQRFSDGRKAMTKTPNSNGLTLPRTLQLNRFTWKDSGTSALFRGCGPHRGCGPLCPQIWVAADCRHKSAGTEARHPDFDAGAEARHPEMRARPEGSPHRSRACPKSKVLQPLSFVFCLLSFRPAQNYGIILSNFLEKNYAHNKTSLRVAQLP